MCLLPARPEAKYLNMTNSCFVKVGAATDQEDIITTQINIMFVTVGSRNMTRWFSGTAKESESNKKKNKFSER